MTEKKWIKESQKGDETAFENLMKTYEQRIFFVCLKIVKDEGIAHDLTQETFVHAFLKLQTFRGESKFYTWIYKIAKNLCLNFLKKKHPTVEFKEKILYPSQRIENVSNLSDEKEVLLKSAVKKLPKKQREVLEMFEYQKIPTKLIAVQLNIPEGTVRSRLHYGRKKIKENLKQNKHFN